MVKIPQGMRVYHQPYLPDDIVWIAVNALGVVQVSKTDGNVYEYDEGHVFSKCFPVGMTWRVKEEMEEAMRG